MLGSINTRSGPRPTPLGPAGRSRPSPSPRRRIYLASAPEHRAFTAIFAALQSHPHVYDARTGDTGFIWPQVDPDWQAAHARHAAQLITDPEARRAARNNRRHVDWADVFIAVLPADHASFIAAGMALAAGKPAALYAAPQQLLPPDFMYGLFDSFHVSRRTLLRWLAALPASEKESA